MHPSLRAIGTPLVTRSQRLCEVESLPLGDDLFAVRITERTMPPDDPFTGLPMEPPRSHSSERIVDRDAYLDICKGTIPTQRPVHVLINTLGRDLLRCHGPDGFAAAVDGTADLSPHTPMGGMDAAHQRIALAALSFLVLHPYTALRQGVGLDVSLVARPNLQQFREMDDSPLPMRQYATHSHGYFENSRYDLVAAIEHLRRRRDVQVMAATRLPLEPTDPAADAVFDLDPVHDTDGTCDAGLLFQWFPTDADWATLVAHRQAHRFEDIWKAVFDTDLLGLRAAGAARCRSFYDKIPIYGQLSPYEDGDA